MKYKYTFELELQHVALGDRMANYFALNESLVLVREEKNCYVVVSFDKQGYCNNAVKYTDEHMAWNFFYEVINDTRVYQKALLK